MTRKLSTKGPDEAEKRAAARARSAEHLARDKAVNAERRAKAQRANGLFDLAEKERSELFAWLRACPYDDAVQQMLREKGIVATQAELNEFFQKEAEEHWQKRIERAAAEANALVELVERNPVRFSSGILAALGQEAFRQIASGQVEPDAMNKIATLFMRARADERADQLGELKREKLRQEMEGDVGLALEQLSEQVNRHPAARAAFEALQRELAGEGENEA